MSGTPTEPTDNHATYAKAEAQEGEAAAKRRRWITFGEVLAVLAVAISALTLWNSWSERSEGDATKLVEAKRDSARAGTLVLTASSSGGSELKLKPASAEQSVQSQAISFPSALGASPVQTTGEPRIEAKWFERALKRARGQAGLPDDSRGDERLPVAITTRFLVDGEAREDVALYDIGYTVSGRWIVGHSISLRGLSLVSHVKREPVQTLLDARWRKLSPRK